MGLLRGQCYVTFRVHMPVSNVCVCVSSGETALRETLSQFETAYLSKSLSRLIDPINLVFSSSSASPPTDDEIEGIAKVISRCVVCTVAKHHVICQSRPQIRHVWLCRSSPSLLGDRLFAVAAPCAWNKLPSPLRRVDSVNTFKRQLKTVIFAQAF